VFNNQKIRHSNYVDFECRIEDKASFIIQMDESIDSWGQKMMLKKSTGDKL
jgi:hypothetical protein